MSTFDRYWQNYVNSADHSVGDDLAYLRGRFADRTFERLLDTACGAGHCGAALNARQRVFFDYSLNMVKAAVSAHPQESGVRGDAGRFPFADAVFDVITCRLALHHFPDPSAFFQESARVLAPGGLLVLIDTVVDVEDDVFNYLEKVRDPSHGKIYRVDELLAFAQSAFFLREFQTFWKKHAFNEWARRLDPSDEHFARVHEAFTNSPAWAKEVLRVETEGATILSYTDRKGCYVFQKLPCTD